MRRFKFLNQFKKKNIEKQFKLKQNILQAARPPVREKSYADACIMRNARTAPADLPRVGLGLYQGFWIYLYFRIRHPFAHLRPVILSADWSISRLQSWTCSSLSTVAEFVKLTQSIVVEFQRQSADLYKVQLCNRQFFVVSTAIYVVKVYECHPLAYI